MRRYLPLVLLLAACGGDGVGPVDPPDVPPVVGDYALVDVNGLLLPVTIGWYTIESASRNFLEDGTYTGEAEIVFATVEADTAAYYRETLAESGTWTHRDGQVYALVGTQEHYRRHDGQVYRWVTSDTLSVRVDGRRITGGTLLYSSAALTYQR